VTATANGKAKSDDTATTFLADTVKTTNDQLITAAKQTTAMTMDATSAVLASLGKLAPSLPSVPSIPFMPTKSGISQLVNVSFDATENLLSLQRGLATEIVERFVPAAGAR
jgi:hypothetical protein